MIRRLVRGNPDLPPRWAPAALAGCVLVAGYVVGPLTALVIDALRAVDNNLADPGD